MIICGKKIEISYNDFEENDIEFDRDKYLFDLQNCETFEEYLNILTKEDYDILARSVSIEYPDHY